MSRFATITSLVIYAVIIAAVVLGMQRVRAWSKTTYGTDAAQQDWDDWRAEATRQSGETGALEGPVKRRPPKSPRPPALVLMDDHFSICLAFALVLSSVLYATLVFMVVGATRPAKSST